jgi:hypothetical protein
MAFAGVTLADFDNAVWGPMAPVEPLQSPIKSGIEKQQRLTSIDRLPFVLQPRTRLRFPLLRRRA